MSDSQFKPWSENPNAPKIPHDLYFAEKVRIAGDFIGAMLYGTRYMSLATRSPIRTHFVCRACPRDPHHAVLQIHECAA